MKSFTKINIGDSVFDCVQQIKGTVLEVNASENKAKLLASTDEEEIIFSRLADLVVVNETKTTSTENDDNQWWNWVRDFQLVFNHPAPDKPTMLSLERVKLRNSFMEEECREMEEAETLVDQVDAALDKLYFALGDLVELGVKPHNALKIVQEANMGKLHNVNGEMIPVYNELGKVKKPADWNERFAPEPLLAAEIERQSK